MESANEIEGKKGKGKLRKRDENSEEPDSRLLVAGKIDQWGKGNWMKYTMDRPLQYP